MRKIYVVGTAYNYANWMQGKITTAIEEADLVVFTGGTDVDAHLYGERRHSEADFPDKERDAREVEAFYKAVQYGIPIVGICRGSQLACVLSKGKLIQHQEHQPAVHDITVLGGRVVSATSSHHQAQYPFLLPEEDYKIIGWTEGLSSFHLDGHGQELNPPKEVEICYYPQTNALAIQSHPEWMNKHKDIEYYQQLLTDHINSKL